MTKVVYKKTATKKKVVAELKPAPKSKAKTVAPKPVNGDNEHKAAIRKRLISG